MTNQYVLCPGCRNYEYSNQPNCRRCGYVFPIQYAPPIPIEESSNALRCDNCGSNNIIVTLNEVGQIGNSNTQRVKRSMAERAAYKTGRGAMNMMTLGTYGLITPKKGKYKEITYSTSQSVSQKIGICQNCGNSWVIQSKLEQSVESIAVIIGSVLGIILALFIIFKM